MPLPIEPRLEVVVAARVTSRRRISREAVLLGLITLLGAGGLSPLHAQQHRPTFPAIAEARAAIYGRLLDSGAGAAPRVGVEHGAAMPAGGRHPIVLAAGGVLGGTVGFWAGGFAGMLVGAISCHNVKHGEVCESRFFSAITLGAVLGEAMLLPLGVHIAERRL